MFFSLLGNTLQNLLFFALHFDNQNSFPRQLTRKEEEECIKAVANGDTSARNRLIQHNMRLVAFIVRRHYPDYRDQEDLISIGTIGLIKGITTFDESKGARLATYAARCVENEILMHFRSQRKSSNDVSLSDYIETGTDGAALSLMDVVSQEEDLTEQVMGRELTRQVLQAVDRVLTPQERQVICLRYGLGSGTPLRQRQVAEKTGISRSYVSRIEKRALEKLRKVLETGQD